MRNARLVVKNGVAHGLYVALALAFLVGGARLLSVEDYGEMRTALTLLPLLMAFSLPGYDSVILRQGHLNRPVPLLRTFVLRVGLGAVGSAAIVAGLLLFGGKAGESLTFFFLAMAALLPLYDTGTGYRNHLIARRLRERALTLVLYVRLAGLAILGAGFGAILLFDLDRRLVFLAWLGATIIPTLAVFLPVALWQEARMKRRGFAGGGPGFDGAGRANLKAAFGMTLAGLVYTLSFSLDKLWVRHELGAEAMASYSVLLMVPQEASRLFDVMVPLFYRVLFFGKGGAEKERLKAWLILFPVVAVSYTAAFTAFSPLVFGATYRYDAGTVALSALLMGGLAFEAYAAHALFARAGARFYLATTLANLAVTAPTVVLALRWGGIEGLIAGLALKQTLVPSAFFLLLRRKKPGR